MVRAFQWDIARQVERLDVLKRLLSRYAEWGYHELYLHLEDAVHYPSLPGVGRSDAYSHKQLGELVRTATRAGIGVVPIINLLGHTQYLIKHPGLRELNELRDEHGAPLEKGQICPLHPRTLEVAEKLLRDMKPFCTTGKVHVGLDESFHLGKCPRCRAEVEKIGLAAHFAGHVQRLHALCAKLGLELGMWADMLYFVPEAIPLLPRGITAYEWYYYPFAKLPRVELFNFAECDLATPLKEQGIRYYGCPMNGAFRYEPMPVFGERLDNIKSWWRRCHEVQAEGLLITSWEPDRLAFETTTVVDAAAASLWLEPEQSDDNVALLITGLQRACNAKQAPTLARALLNADAFAFAGYARWQINERWDLFASEEGIASYERERRFFHRLAQRARRDGWPESVASGLEFRVYVAERDVFVRRAAADVFRLRRLIAKDHDPAGLLRRMEDDSRVLADELARGKIAASQMWRGSRSHRKGGKNLELLRADAARLGAWQRWLKAVMRHPERAWAASPVCGEWQLHFWVHNIEPACQRVAVEVRDDGGDWRQLAGRHTIEFRAAAARPATRWKRGFSVPVADVGASLRIRLSGVGRVKVSHIQLTNGVTVKRAVDFRERKILGRRAPSRGLPNVAPHTGDATLRVYFED